MCWFCPWFWMCFSGIKLNEDAKIQNSRNYVLRIENERLRRRLNELGNN